MHYRTVKTEAAGEIEARKTIAGEDAAGDVAAQPALADYIYRLVLGDFLDMFPKFIYRDIEKSIYMSLGILAGGTGV